MLYFGAFRTLFFAPPPSMSLDPWYKSKIQHIKYSLADTEQSIRQKNIVIDSHSCRIMSKQAIFFRIFGSGRHVNALTVEQGRCDSLQECTYAKHICNGLHAWLRSCSLPIVLRTSRSGIVCCMNYFLLRMRSASRAVNAKCTTDMTVFWFMYHLSSLQYKNTQV